VKLSASIMGHPDRGREIANLLVSLGALETPISLDQEGPPSGDHDRVWRNARAAWLMHDPAADWHVLIQDDAVVCRDFLAGLERALEHVPQTSAIVSGYLGRGRHVPQKWARLAERADQAGACWVVAQKLMWGVCIAIPTRYIGEMISFADRRPGIPDDMRVAGWVTKTFRECWYPWPSLVDHREVPSLTKHNARERRAMRHHAGSAMEIDWSGPQVADPMLMRRKAARSGPSNRRLPTLHKATGR
jgi:hypothetical protein